MATTPDLTLREAAILAEVPKKAVEKAVETRVLSSLSHRPRFRGSGTRYVPLRAVAYFAAIRRAELEYLPVKVKRAIWTKLMRLEPTKLEPIEFAPGARLDIRRLARAHLEKASDYKAARDTYIVSDPDILGGTPVIKGTRITVYAVLGRLQDGETVDDLAHDNPDVPREAFEAAAIFAKAHPLRGRPSGRPWHNAA